MSDIFNNHRYTTGVAGQAHKVRRSKIEQIAEAMIVKFNDRLVGRNSGFKRPL
jgi:hypothetical protein